MSFKKDIYMNFLIKKYANFVFIIKNKFYIFIYFSRKCNLKPSSSQLHFTKKRKKRKEKTQEKRSQTWDLEIY